MKRSPIVNGKRQETIRLVKEAQRAFDAVRNTEAGQYWGGIGAEEVGRINRMNPDLCLANGDEQ